MGTTIERNGGTLPQSNDAPAHDTLSPEQRVHMHELPDLSALAPEVEYGQPRRSWLRYLAVGAAVGAVAVGAGLVVSTLGTDDVTGGLPSDSQVMMWPNAGPVNDAPGSMIWPNAGPVNDAPGSMIWGNAGPVNDAPGSAGS